LPLLRYVGETVYTYFEDAQNGDFSKTKRGTDVVNRSHTRCKVLERTSRTCNQALARNMCTESAGQVKVWTAS